MEYQNNQKTSAPSHAAERSNISNENNVHKKTPSKESYGSEAAALIGLQSTMGNTAVVNLFKKAVPIQAKLKVGKPNDAYEQEADRVAIEVVNKISNSSSEGDGNTQEVNHSDSIQRKPDISLLQRQPEEDEEPLQAKTDSSVIQREAEEEEEEVQAKADPSVIQREAEEEEEAVQAKADSSVIQREAEEEEEEVQAKADSSVIQREAEEEEEEVQAKADPSVIQREAEEEEEEPLQAKAASAKLTIPHINVEHTIAQESSGGSSMEPSILRKMNGAFGSDFSSVKIHTGQTSDVLNRSLGARAFTTGSNIFFKEGEYNPGSIRGQELLAHELTHVVQQRGSAVMKKEAPEIQLKKLNVNSTFGTHLRSFREGKIGPQTAYSVNEKDQIGDKLKNGTPVEIDDDPTFDVTKKWVKVNLPGSGFIHNDKLSTPQDPAAAAAGSPAAQVKKENNYTKLEIMSQMLKIKGWLTPPKESDKLGTVTSIGKTALKAGASIADKVTGKLTKDGSLPQTITGSINTHLGTVFSCLESIKATYEIFTKENKGQRIDAILKALQSYYDTASNIIDTVGTVLKYFNTTIGQWAGYITPIIGIVTSSLSIISSVRDMIMAKIMRHSLDSERAKVDKEIVDCIHRTTSPEIKEILKSLITYLRNTKNIDEVKARIAEHKKRFKDFDTKMYNRALGMQLAGKDKKKLDEMNKEMAEREDSEKLVDKYFLAAELDNINRKRVNRGAVNVIPQIMNLIGEITNIFSGGIAAAIGTGTKAVGLVTSIATAGARFVKKKYRDWGHGDQTKTSKAKDEVRTKNTETIMNLIKELPAYSEKSAGTYDSVMHFLYSTGVNIAQLLSMTEPYEQFNLIREAMAKRQSD